MSKTFFVIHSHLVACYTGHAFEFPFFVQGRGLNDKIAFSCPKCGHQMSLPAELMGKFGKCPSCSEVVPISPTHEGATPEPSPAPDITLQDPFEKSPDALQQAPPETPPAEPPAERAAPNVSEVQETPAGRFGGMSKYLIGAAVGSAVTAGLFLLLGGA